MQASFNQMIILFAFILIGFVMKRTKLLPPDTSGVLAKLLVYVILPALIINTFEAQFKISNLKENALYLLVGAVTLLIIMAVSALIARIMAKENYERSVIRYTLITPNYGYIGYTLMAALYGQEMLMKMMVFGIPLSIYIYTEGFRILTDRKGISLKNLINPCILSLAVGCLIGLSGIGMPSVLSSILGSASTCMAPLSMILTGVVLADCNLWELIQDGRVYIVTVLRLLVIPAIVVAVYYFLGLSSTLLIIAVMLYAMPGGMNTIIYPNLIGKDCKIGSALVLVSNVLAVGTIPLCVMLLEKII